ncbi:MAG TPA: hypothetical protein P5121_28510 [Caldilineaceae bacterium]|nr:hypothetical protein [Caldilineaceae bacterium]
MPEIIALHNQLLTNLPKPVFARAWQQGQHLDLQHTIDELQATLKAKLQLASSQGLDMRQPNV